MRSLKLSKDWLAAQLLERRPVISCLLFAIAAILLLMVFVSLQAYALFDPKASAFYRPGALVASQAVMAVVIAGLACVALYCGGKRKAELICSWLPVLTVTPTMVVLMGLAVAHGLKDTPISLAVLTTIMLSRALFDFKVLVPSLVAGAGMVLAHEVLVGMDVMSYAPMLVQPIFSGGDLAWWWQIWCRVVLDFCLVSFLGMVLFLFSTLGQRRRELESLVRTDMLTGLANRRTFMAQLEIESHRHARTKRPFSLVICDVDHFKAVNDTWGHPAGDAVLVALGRVLKSTTREQIDMAARIGGEEFAVLLPETGLEQAQRLAQLMSSGVRAQVFTFEGQQFSVTQSVGIAQTDDGNGDAAMRVADDNLYMAKRQGRDRVVASVVAPSTPRQETEATCAVK